jgi:hypothetical protein
VPTTRTVHLRGLRGSDLPGLAGLDGAGLARLLLDATDALGSGADTVLVVVCHRGAARLAALVVLPEADVALLAPLLTGDPPVADHIRAALDGAFGIARRAGHNRLRLSVPTAEVDVRDVAEALGYELTGAGAVAARPDLDLPGRDTWTLSLDTARSRDEPSDDEGHSLV